MNGLKLPEIVSHAKEGKQEALGQLVQMVQDKIFNISLYYTGDLSQAEDATQEILIKVIEKLESLKEPDRFENWSYTIAYNYLKNLKRGSGNYNHISFELMEADSSSHHAREFQEPTEHEEIRELAYELKISCTIAMLMCLTEDERIVFILSELLNTKSREGAEVLGISSEAFRKKLSRSKKRLLNFIENNCGLINKDNPCKCRERVNYALARGRIFSAYSSYISEKYIKYPSALDKKIVEMENLEDFGEIYLNNPEYRLSDKVLKRVFSLAKE